MEPEVAALLMACATTKVVYRRDKKNDLLRGLGAHRLGSNHFRVHDRDFSVCPSPRREIFGSCGNPERQAKSPVPPTQDQHLTKLVGQAFGLSELDAED